MSYMSIWSPSDAEKDNILNQHNKPYDGYATLRQSQTNQTPLMVQDFAKDKKGMTVGNNGKVQGFTNVGINEGLYGQNLDVQQDLDPKAGFDYVQGSSNDEDTFEGMHKNLYKKSMEEDYDEMDPAYDFDTDGPEEFETKSDFDSLNQEYQTQQDELDYESQHDTDPEAREMISRMQKMMNKDKTLTTLCLEVQIPVNPILIPQMVNLMKNMMRKCLMKTSNNKKPKFWKCLIEYQDSK